MTTENHRVLTPRERRQATDELIKAETRITGYAGRVSETGHVSMRAIGPRVLQRGDYWAEIYYGNWLTHPSVIMLNIFWCVVTCGLYSIWWFYQTFKQPPIWRYDVNEYGSYTSTQREIPAGQKVIRYLLLAWFAFWAIFWGVGIVGYITGVDPGIGT